jgi:hypothetical protein
MTPSKLFLIAFWVAVGIFVGTWMIRLFWRLRSDMKRRAAGDAPLHSSRALIWRDPGPADQRDLAAGPGGREGAPVPPFQFIEEHTAGSQPCVSVRDARGRVWRVKWGAEVHTEVFGTRLAWAAGYFAETTFFMPDGTILGADTLQRARQSLDAEGHFRDARFELDEQGVVKHFDEHSWAWNDNPFVGTHELNGLKIVMMLLSNWDNKDVRDVARGSNTAIFEYTVDHTREARYLIIDWGAALGTWGSNVLSRGRWNAEAFASQNDQFILGTDGDRVLWGYKGQRTADAVQDISKHDVRWLYKYLGPVTDDQIAAALRASGATETEIADFTKALRARLDRLREIAGSAMAAAPSSAAPTSV